MKKLFYALAVAGLLFSAEADAATYTYKTIDVTSADATQLKATNTRGAIVGNFLSGGSRHGFLQSNGALTTVDHPSAQNGTDLTSINDKLQAVGNFTASGLGNAFLYANGAFTPITNADATNGITATGINGMGSIVGEYLDANGLNHSFVDKGGTFTLIDHWRAAAGQTHFSDINNVGWELGTYQDAAGIHGFLDASGAFVDINHPSADAGGTIVTGTNTSGLVVGYYHDTLGTHGFVYQTGVFTPFSVPTAPNATFPMGINDNGVVSGYYTVNGVNHGFTATPDRPAVRTRDVTSKLGVNIHLNFTNLGYQDPDGVIASLKYLMVKNVRDSPTRTSMQTWSYVAQGAGVKFDAFIPMGSPSAMSQALSYMPALAQAGLLNFIEGGNEEDDLFATSNGNSISQAAQFQQQVFQTGRSLNLPVINLSFGSGWTNANNLAGNYDKPGDLSAYCDYANAHTFPYGEIGHPSATFQMLIRNAHMAASLRPVFHTEIGWDSRTAEKDVPTNLLQGVMDAVLDGSAGAYIYALYNDKYETFGLMNPDSTPKPEGVAFHNLMVLLNDTGSTATTFTPMPLAYEVTNTTGGERTYLMQKSTGTYILAVWNETHITHDVTVTLGAPATSIRVFNPLLSTTPLQAVSNAQAVTFAMTGAPILLAITAASGTTAPSPPPTTITTSASNTVINADPSTTAISVYGTGDTINGSTGTYTVLALKGSNTINTNGGTATIYLGGSSNKVNINSGSVVIRDSGNSGTFSFGAPGSGSAETYGYIFSQNDILDFHTLLTGTQWDGATTTVGNFLKLSTVGSNTVIQVNPSGLTTGATLPVVVLHGYSNMSLSTLLAHARL